MKSIGRKALTDVLGTLQGRGGLVAATWRHLGGKGPHDDHKEWAKILQVRHESGEHLSLLQIQNYREALGIKVEE